MMVLGLWFALQDLFLAPFRFVRTMAKSVSTPGVPWIAVVLTFFWCLVEAVVFTYAMTPLVMDTLANLTGGELSQGLIHIPLFLFMLFLILGSYAVLAVWTEALKTRDIPFHHKNFPGGGSGGFRGGAFPLSGAGGFPGALVRPAYLERF